MKRIIAQSGVVLALLLGLVVSYPVPAEALPIGGHPDKCQGPYPSGGPACENAGGHVWCTNDGDYMCCFVNSQTGAMNCSQIETFTAPQSGSIRAPGGKLQMSPTTPTTKQPKAPTMGTTTAPLMRRGVEGEQGAESESGTEKSAPSQSGEKK